uniref:Uncharacterized protein n=1 Tax=Acrobeloides nanus TaxID=290746 RepID=A0A914DWS2_9BILA
MANYPQEDECESNFGTCMNESKCDFNAGQLVTPQSCEMISPEFKCCMNFHKISLNEIKSLENNCGCDPSPQLNNATCDTWRNKTLPLGTKK